MNKMKALFAEIKSKEKLEAEQRDAVLFTLFKTHHVLRTNVAEGILSLHNRKYYIIYSATHFIN